MLRSHPAAYPVRLALLFCTIVVAFVRAGLKAGNQPVEVCESLLDACLSPDPRGTRYAGCDNMTVVLVLLEGWETALATRAHPPALTFSGGRLGSVAEAAAVLSATLPKLPRRKSEPRPPLPAEFRAASEALQRENQAAAGGAAAGTVTEQASGTAASSGRDESSKEQQARPSAEAAAAAAGRQANGARRAGNRRRSEADAAAILARRVRNETACGGAHRRLSLGGVSRPRTAHGIEFSLASFSAPPLPAPRLRARPRSNSSRSNSAGNVIAAANGSVIAAATAAGVRSKSWNPGASPDSARRSAIHHCSATAPMLPTPLIHHRRAPSEERIASAAAVAALAEVGAAGAVAVAAASQENAVMTEGNWSGRQGRGTQDHCGDSGAVENAAIGISRCGISTSNGGGRLGGRSGSKDGLVFVPAPDSVTPIDVTVTTTAVASPSRSL